MSKRSAKIVITLPKPRNLVARELVCNANFKPRTMKDKTKYSRKHRGREAWD